MSLIGMAEPELLSEGLDDKVFLRVGGYSGRPKVSSITSGRNHRSTELLESLRV